MKKIKGELERVSDKNEREWEKKRGGGGGGRERERERERLCQSKHAKHIYISQVKSSHIY